MTTFDASEGLAPDPDAWAFDAWEDGPDGLPLTESQLALQQDLSALADGELDEGRAAVAMLRVEGMPRPRRSSRTSSAARSCTATSPTPIA